MSATVVIFLKVRSLDRSNFFLLYLEFVCYNMFWQPADVAELVDALDLGSSVLCVRVRVSSSAF